MLYHRQRLLLALLDSLDGSVTNTDFQKLLFLYCQEFALTPSYDFVPYRFGAFSFTSYSDKRKLTSQGLLADDGQQWALTAAGRKRVSELRQDSACIRAFSQKYADLRGDRLIAAQYSRYPYYATRSEILGRLKLDHETLATIKAAAPRCREPGLVTIGYEGQSVESYLNALLGNGVTLLCDVRKNPLSRKYGFSKSTLATACEGVGIRYEHLPELGIDSEQRKGLATQADYDALFAVYERQTLPVQQGALREICGWIKSGERVALTCFEHLPEQCHRHCVAEALVTLSDDAFITEHL